MECDVRGASLWRAVLGLDKTVIESVELDEAGDELIVVACVRPTRSARSRCGVCGRRCRGYDPGNGRRRWRALDLGTIPVWVEANAPRVRCCTHDVVVAAVPWARHNAGHTHAFDATVAWLATKCSKTAVTELMRIAWRTVGAILTRVWSDADAAWDRWAGVRRIGIDEISYKKGHKYLTVVVDHDSGHLLWAAPGRDAATLRAFFDLLGAQRSAQITHVSADGAPWIATVLAERCPTAIVCADPFLSSNGPPRPLMRCAKQRGTMRVPQHAGNPNALAGGPALTQRTSQTGPPLSALVRSKESGMRCGRTQQT